jgi:serine phosphatase RsbU (regulator of sigma subunit)
MNKLKFKLLAVIISIIISVFTNSASWGLSRTISLNDGFDRINVGKYMDYFEDAGNSLGINDIMSGNHKHRWGKSAEDSPSFGFTSSAYWVRFTVENSSNNDIEFYLENAYPLIDNIRFYAPENGSFSEIVTGDYKPFSSRPIDSRTFIFPLKLKAKSNATYYMYIDLRIWMPESYRKAYLNETRFLMMFYGILLVMVAYNLIVFFFIRTREYLFYVILVLILLLFQMTLEGTSFQYLWPDNPWWINMSMPVLINLTMLSIGFFSQELAGLKHSKKPYLRKLHARTRICYMLYFIFFIISLFTPYLVTITLSAFLAGLLLTYILILAVILIVKEKNRSIIIATSAASGILIGGIAFVLKSFAILPTNFFTQWSVHIGAVIMVVLFSSALSDRVNIMRKELGLLNEHLEDKVRERTEELKKAMENLEASNQRLIEAKNALWGEMELAKKIQTALLPHDPAIRGYDICAYMNPAAEVGGDYYDVINTGDIDWVVIGDVSGHGVPAGLIMMMVQTSIQFVMCNDPGTAPSRMLAAINKSIYKNIITLNEDKYMTITVLAIGKGGAITHSGLHEDMMLYRADSGSAERIKTSGMWIGIVESIDDKLKDDTFIMNRGDILLLFTDGVTEAWRKNGIKGSRDPEIDMFGRDRLSETFRKACMLSPEGIRDAILKELGEFTISDDITLVVIKRTE